MRDCIGDLDDLSHGCVFKCLVLWCYAGKECGVGEYTVSAFSCEEMCP